MEKKKKKPREKSLERALIESSQCWIPSARSWLIYSKIYSKTNWRSCWRSTEEALLHEFRTDYPWELLYGDDPCIWSKKKLCLWKRRFSEVGLEVNMVKTKLMVCGRGMNSLLDPGKYPCGVCCESVKLIHCG